MPRLKNPATCILFSAAILLAAPLQAENPESGVDAPSEAVLKKLAAALSGAQRLSMRLEADVVIDAGPEIRHKGRSSSTIRMEKPGRYRVEGAMDDMQITAISDGKNLLLHTPKINRYLKAVPPGFPIADTAATNEIAQVVGMATGGNDILSLGLLEDAYAALVKEARSIRYVGKEEVDGQATHHLRMIDGYHDLDMWITDGEQPVILKTKAQLTEIIEKIKQQAPEGTIITAEMTTAFKDWTYGGEIPAKTFDPVAPEGAEEADSLGALFGMDEPAAARLKGKPAPDFTLDLLDGTSFTLKTALEKDIVILDFWATWCGPCVMAMPELEALAKAYQGKGVRLIAVNQREPVEKIKSFLADKKLSATVALDKTSSVASQYGVQGIPQTVVVGKDGNIADVHVGFSPNLKAELSKVLDELIAAGE